ncbi:MAG: hypothetical protein EOO27_08625 [Comamonadaceae bacterium]|nr:MAG: hypothetical protein EOO27_08625 [Comamonadaceae bacterium]
MTSLTRGANSPIDTATTTVEVTGAGRERSICSVEIIDTLSDAALYELLLSEYPDWLRGARKARILS